MNDCPQWAVSLNHTLGYSQFSLTFLSDLVMSYCLLIYILIINTLQTLYKPRPMFYISYYNWIRSIGCIQLCIISRSEGEDDNKRENVVGIAECDGKKQREQGREHYVPESQYFLMQLSAALVSEDENLVLLTQLRYTVDINHYTWWMLLWYFPLKEAVFLPIPWCALCIFLPRWLHLWQQRFFWNDTDVNACEDTSSHSAFLLHSHTVTAEMEQEAVRNRTRAAVFTGS